MKFGQYYNIEKKDRAGLKFLIEYFPKEETIITEIRILSGDETLGEAFQIGKETLEGIVLPEDIHFQHISGNTFRVIYISSKLPILKWVWDNE
jgi:hypothetical protein